MTNRERFHRALRFEKADRLPMLEWASWWDKTVVSWEAQGLKIMDAPGLTRGEALQAQFGLDLNMQLWPSIATGATPSPAYHGAPIAFDAADYERIRPTLFPKEVPSRGELERLAKRQATGEAIAWVSVDGFFWGPRALLGIEPHLYAFYDEPELLHRINGDLLEFMSGLFDRVFEVFTPDFMTFGEDMSYNLGPMLSEAMFDEFMLPYYEKIVPRLKARGTRVFVDSDGDVTQMIPWFERAGIEGILPLERQAGVDVAALRKAHPDFLFIGHFDKMAMPLGEEAMRAEFERLLPAMKTGGFIPSVDHQTPPGVTLDQYHTYLRLYREYCEKACR